MKPVSRAGSGWVMAPDLDTVWCAALARRPGDVVIPPGKPAMDLRWTFRRPVVDLDAGAEYLGDDSFEFAVVIASAYCLGCGPAWSSCGSGPRGLRVRFFWLYEVSAYIGECRMVLVRAGHGVCAARQGAGACRMLTDDTGTAEQTPSKRA